MDRVQRERLILSLIGQKPIGTQQELVEALEARGVEATQATVSRDIRRLGLTKVPAPGGYRYQAPLGGRPAVGSFVVGLDEAQAFVVVKTLSGRASAVACAIDEAALDQVSGTLAGDDTVLVLVRRRSATEGVKAALEELL